jgi:uncharacterized protein
LWLFAFCRAAIAEGPEGGRPALWELRSASTSIYIFGSLHVAKPDFYPLPEPVEAAYRKAEILAVEIDADFEDARAMDDLRRLMMYPPQDGIDRHLSAATWRRLQSLAADARVDPAQLKPYRPGALMSSLTIGALMSRGYDARAGIDRHFLERARADGKQVIAFETAEFQAGLLADLTDDEGDELVGQTLDALGNGDLARLVDAMAHDWKTGDTEGLARHLREANKGQASERLFRRMFDDRNPAMADRIAALAAGGKPAVVVVGAGHVVGRNGLVDLLSARGFEVRRVE